MPILHGNEAIEEYKRCVPNISETELAEVMAFGDEFEFDTTPVVLRRKYVNLKKVLMGAGMAKSKMEANRLIKQNAVKIDGEKYSGFIYPIFINSETGKASIDIRVGYREKLVVFEE